MDEKKIIDMHLVTSGCGTHKFYVEWTGEWEEIDLITAVDNRIVGRVPTDEDLKRACHFGGRIEDYKVRANGVQTGIVCVYFD